jgi:hypothetical protein
MYHRLPKLQRVMRGEIVSEAARLLRFEAPISPYSSPITHHPSPITFSILSDNLYQHLFITWWTLILALASGAEIV